MYKTTFKVIGSLPFPVDMLRYDGCFPRNQESVAAIHATFDSQEPREKRTVELTMLRGRPKQFPTVARWALFSWEVDPNSVRLERV